MSNPDQLEKNLATTRDSLGDDVARSTPPAHPTRSGLAGANSSRAEPTR